jgi:hypothetical protein
MKFGIGALDIVALSICVFDVQRIYCMGANGITLMHILQDTLEVKKSLVNFLLFVTEYRMCGLAPFFRPLLDSFFTALNHFVLTQVWGWKTGIINSQNTLL